MNDFANASGANPSPPKTRLTCRPATDTDTDKNGGDNANNIRRMSLATRAGALVRQLSSRANVTSETQPLTTTSNTTSTTTSTHASPKMALFHTRTASVHVENGEWSLALKSHNRALIHHRQLHGQDSAQCATTLNGIGVCLMNLATGGPRSLDEESPLCRDYVRYAECALREALYIREQIFGTESDEVEEVEINMELLLGSGWKDDDDETSKVDRSRPAAPRSRGSSNPPSRCSSTDSLSGNNFQRAARRLFGGGTGSTSTNNVKTLRQSQNQMCGNDTASSSSSSSSSLSAQEEQIDFQYPSSFVDVDISAKDQSIASTPSTTAAPSSSSSSSSWEPCSSPSNRSQTSSSSHSTASFGNEGDDDDDDDDGIGGMGIGEIDLWALDDGSGDEIEEHRQRSTPLHRPLNCSASRSKGRGGAGRPSPTHACSVLFPSIN